MEIEKRKIFFILAFILLPLVQINAQVEHKLEDLTLSDIASRLHDRTPEKVDVFTTLQKVQFVAPSTLLQVYKLEGDMDVLTSPQNKKNIIETLVLNIQQTPIGAIFRKLNTSFHFQYLNPANELVMEITVDSSIYNNPQRHSATIDTYAMLQQVAAETNELLPLDVDESTTFRSAKAVEPDVLEYIFVMKGIPQGDLVANKDLIKKDLANEIKNNAALIRLRAADVKFRYIYRTVLGETLITVNITPDDYKQEAQ